MALITFDSQRAFKIPDNKRDSYFAWIDGFISRAKIGHTTKAGALDVSNDPIVIFDYAYFTPLLANEIEFMMKQWGATDITETLID